MRGRAWAERWVRPYVILVALHSYAVGAALVLVPEWGLAFGGFEAESYFFARQGGVFHFVVATGYWLEFERHGTLDFMVVAKTIAVVFLFTSTAFGEPWVVALSGVGDGVMLGLTLWFRGRLARADQG